MPQPKDLLLALDRERELKRGPYGETRINITALMPGDVGHHRDGAGRARLFASIA